MTAEDRAEVAGRATCFRTVHGIVCLRLKEPDERKEGCGKGERHL